LYCFILSISLKGLISCKMSEAESKEEYDEEMGEGSEVKESKEDMLGEEGTEVQQFDPKNVSRVTFTPAAVKHVISHHKSSILAQDGPVVPLSAESKERVAKVFHSVVEGGEDGEGGASEPVVDEKGCPVLPLEKMAEVFTQSEVAWADAKLVEGALDDVVDRKMDGDTFDVDAAIGLAERFQNPSFHFGQRLRRYAGRGCADEVSKILVRGCNPNAGDGEGLTALHYAAEFNKLDVITTIRDVAGENLLVDAQCRYGWTPLHCAVHHGNPDAVDLLIEMGAGLEVPTSVEKTPLHLGAAQGRVEICEKLVAAGANIDALDKHKMTPTHDAAYKGHPACYQALLRAGANADILDELGNSAASYLEDVTGINRDELEEIDAADEKEAALSIAEEKAADAAEADAKQAEAEGGRDGEDGTDDLEIDPK